MIQTSGDLPICAQIRPKASFIRHIQQQIYVLIVTLDLRKQTET